MIVFPEKNTELSINKYRVYLFILSVIVGCNLFAMNDGDGREVFTAKDTTVSGLEWLLNKSGLSLWYDWCIRSNKENKKLIGELTGVSACYRQLGHEAYELTNVSENRRVPFINVHIKGVTKRGPTTVGASVGACIVLDEKKMENLSYGVKRIIVLHETMHHKFMDEANRRIIEDLPAGVCLGVSTLLTCVNFAGAMRGYALSQMKYSFGGQIVAALGIIYFSWHRRPSLLAKRYMRYCERRADVEAAYASGCHVCVREMANLRNSDSGRNYLKDDEFARIAQGLAKENLRCSEHQKTSI